MTDTPKCELCGEPMPDGETMFKFHGYSGECPKPPLNAGRQVKPHRSGGGHPASNTGKWTSHAQWPLDTYKGMYGDGISTDTHPTKEHADAVCEALQREGFGGERKAFPLKTWVTPNVEVTGAEAASSPERPC